VTAAEEQVLPGTPRGETVAGALAAETGSEQVLWTRFVEAATTAAFCQAWLALQCRQIQGVSGAMALLGRHDTGPYSPVAVWPYPQRNLEHLTGAAERALRERRGVVVEGGTTGPGGLPASVHLAYPLEVSGRLHGVVVVEARARPAAEVQELLRQLHWGIAWLEVLLRRQAAEEETAVRERVFAALDLTATAVEERRFQAAATALVTELATRLDCDRASLGFVRGERVRVQAISHSATFGREMDLVRSLEAAMAEAVDQQSTVLLPVAGEGPTLITRAHEALVQQHGSGAVCTVPVAIGDRFAAALTLERPASRPFEAGEVELCETLGALTCPVLELKRDRERWLGTKVALAARDELARLFGPRYLGRKLAAASAVAFVAFFTFVTGDYRVSADTALEGAVVRAVTAPFEGYIAQASFRAGDTVQKGAVLATLDDRDMKVERVRLATERAQHVRERREAAAKHERAQVRILSAQIQQAEAQLELIDEQLARTRLAAPFDGVLVKGDLSQSLGAPVQRGDTLFEIAPLASYRLAMQVDERDILDVEVGATGTLVLGAMPQASLAFKVTLITPVTSAAEGRNVFRVEGELDAVPAGVRPGMEGVAKIDAGERRLIWIWTRTLWQWLEMKLWAWWP
jgi:multidrug resistance efflux pump